MDGAIHHSHGAEVEVASGFVHSPSEVLLPHGGASPLADDGAGAGSGLVADVQPRALAAAPELSGWEMKEGGGVR